MAGKFQCTVITPQRRVLDEEVVYASVPAWDGLTGLMPGRAPMVAKLGDGPLRLDYAAGGSRWFFVSGGFAQMKDNRLTLITDEAVPATEIQQQDVLATLKEAIAFTPHHDEDFIRNQRTMNRARTLLQLSQHVDKK